MKPEERKQLVIEVFDRINKAGDFFVTFSVDKANGSDGTIHGCGICKDSSHPRVPVFLARNLSKSTIVDFTIWHGDIERVRMVKNEIDLPRDLFIMKLEEKIRAILIKHKDDYVI